jgi:hypothetical protein
MPDFRPGFELALPAHTRGLMGLIERACLFGNTWWGSHVFPKGQPRSIPSIRAGELAMPT